MRRVSHISRWLREAGASGALLVVMLVLAALATPAAAAPSAAKASATAGDVWSWSVSARSWTSTNGVLPASLVAKGPTAPITRAQFLGALVRLETLRAEDGDRSRRGLRDVSVSAPALADAAAGTVAARAVALGWMPARRGRFAGASAITSNEAALAVAAAVGLRPQVVAFASKLRTEVPGSRATLHGSAQAIVRTLGMRYNVTDPNDRLEIGPDEAVNVAHGAYMLQVAGSKLESWRIDGARRMVESFDLPALGPNQARILGTAVRQLGQPYIWGGETEGSQAEGHGGFDCSGFTLRVVNGSGVPATQLASIGERTTYTQSALPGGQRIGRARLQSTDALYFGDNGPRSTPTQNYHAGIYMGNGWFIHSSGGNGGVAIDSLDGWWSKEFSWGRRTLRQR